jgi:hypothetical protein
MADLEKNGEWARLLYRNQIDGIEAVKRRQWATTNYVLLIFAAIIGFVKTLEWQNGCFSILLLLGAVIISIMGIFHLIDMQLVLTQYRLKLSNISKKYTFVKSFDLIADKDSSFWKYFFCITAFFVGLIISAVILVLIFLEKNNEIPLPGFLLGNLLFWVVTIDIIAAIWFACIKCREATKFEKELEIATRSYCEGNADSK